MQQNHQICHKLFFSVILPLHFGAPRSSCKCLLNRYLGYDFITWLLTKFSIIVLLIRSLHLVQRNVSQIIRGIPNFHVFLYLCPRRVIVTEVIAHWYPNVSVSYNVKFRARFFFLLESAIIHFLFSVKSSFFTVIDAIYDMFRHDSITESWPKWLCLRILTMAIR